MTTSTASTASNSSRNGVFAAALIGGALLLAACDATVDFTIGEDGNGEETTLQHTLADFSQIEVDGVFDVDVNVEAGSTQSVEVTTDSNLHDNLRVEVVNGRLILDIKDSLDPTETLHVDIVVDELDRIDVDGASEVRIEGSGGDLVAVTSGVGRLEAGGYEAGNIRVDADGASDLRVQARGVVTGSADGVASVHVTSAERVDVRTSGIASLDRP